MFEVNEKLFAFGLVLLKNRRLPKTVALPLGGRRTLARIHDTSQIWYIHYSYTFFECLFEYLGLRIWTSRAMRWLLTNLLYMGLQVCTHIGDVKLQYAAPKKISCLVYRPLRKFWISEHNERVPVNIHRFSFLLSAAKNEHQEPTVYYGFYSFFVHKTQEKWAQCAKQQIKKKERGQKTKEMRSNEKRNR